MVSRWFTMFEPSNPIMLNGGESPDPNGVLIVDDHPDVLQTMADMVESLGYLAITAQNGRDALQILAEPNDIALVITDVVMPGEINGIELANTVSTNFHIPTVLATGFPRHRSMRDIGDHTALLLKPFSLDQLDQRISASLTTQ